MCGIIAYLGFRAAVDICLQGLHRLEYRGYDSAGLCFHSSDVPGTTGNALTIVKKMGKVAVLEANVRGRADLAALHMAMGHTRWATHGEPSDDNSHPHCSNDRKLAIIHNGIIENYSVLRESLQGKGYKFFSKTDTEALAILIEDVLASTQLDLIEAVREALSLVRGTFGIVIMHADHPGLMIGARKGSPLLVGVGTDPDSAKEEYFIASDAAPFIEYTKYVIHLHDSEMVVVQRGKGVQVMTLENLKIDRKLVKLEWDLEQIEKGGHPHFMVKEILEQPVSIANCMRGRIRLNAPPGEPKLVLGGLQNAPKSDLLESMVNARRIVIVACGTSWHAGLVGEYMIEYLAHIPVEVEYASEFRYRELILDSSDVVLAISQSGETADTLEAIRIAKTKGATVVGVCNVVGSTIPRETDGGVYLHVGPEIGVGSTKAFTGQVCVLAMIALCLAYRRKVHSEEKLDRILTALSRIPEQVERFLSTQLKLMEEISKVFRFATNFLFLGRGYEYPVALEGALKLKEISYIHAEGYPAAEMKHGPIALIDPLMPVVVIATRDRLFEKLKSSIEEIRSRRGSVIAITDEGNTELDGLCEYVIHVPITEECLQPLLTVEPMQLLSYYIAVLRGCNVDQPRNLAKSVTVE